MASRFESIIQLQKKEMEYNLQLHDIYNSITLHNTQPKIQNILIGLQTSNITIHNNTIHNPIFITYQNIINKRNKIRNKIKDIYDSFA